MNKTDRLLAIVLELQRAKQLRAEDLAATFETSKRTIYRDIEALCESGVPIVAVTGQGYSLAEGYFLPPLAFSVDEATMLLLGADFMAQNFDAQYHRAAQTAMAKIQAILPERARQDVDYLQKSMVFVAADGAALHDTLAHIRRAILERRTLKFKYDARMSKQKLETREVDPYSLVNVNNVWYLQGYDHAREAQRSFRLSRIGAVSITTKLFERPRGYAPQDGAATDHRPIAVRVLFAPEAAPWVREQPNYFTTEMREAGDGLLVTLHVRDEIEIFQWVLGWGAQARVMEPESLRQRVLAESKKVLELLT